MHWLICINGIILHGVYVIFSFFWQQKNKGILDNCWDVTRCLLKHYYVVVVKLFEVVARVPRRLVGFFTKHIRWWWLFSCQAQHPHRPPCQPVRGHSNVSEPPAGLHAYKPARLLPWQDGLPSGPGERSGQHETGTLLQTPSPVVCMY